MLRYLVASTLVAVGCQSSAKSGTKVSLPEPGDPGSYQMLPPVNTVAIGPQGPTSPPNSGPTVTRDYQWTTLSLDDHRLLNAVWAAQTDDVWMGSPLLHYDGQHFDDSFVRGNVEAIGGVTSDNVYAAVFDSTPTEPEIYHFDGTSWTGVAEVEGIVYAIYARLGGDVYIASDVGLLHSVDSGHTFKTIVAGPPCEFDGVTGTDDEVDAVAACGTHGAVYFQSVDGGNSFATIPIGDFQGLAIAENAGTVFVTGYTDPVSYHVLRSTKSSTFIDVSPQQPFHASKGNGVLALSASDVWIGDYEHGNGIARTQDGGITWTVEYPSSGSIAGLSSSAGTIFAIEFDSASSSLIQGTP